MVIIEDTRQKLGKHESKHRYWDEHGIKWARHVLPFADYWLVPDAALGPDADINEFVPLVAVDTKQDIHEVAMNMCGAGREKRRFFAECKKAQDAGTKLVFLIEDTHYNVPEDLLGKVVYLHSKRFLKGEQVFLAMRIHEERYGCEFWFCDPTESGRVIKELLEDG